MPVPQFVTVGHVVRDLVPGGWRLGGTTTFAAVQAHKLEQSVGIVTHAGSDLDLPTLFPFAEIARGVSHETTTFENVYEHGVRRQQVRARADAITIDQVPRDWLTAPIALIGPVFAEVDPSLAAMFDRSTLTGVSAQGWLRALDRDGSVVRAAWDGAPFWRGASAVFVSDEDLASGRAEVAAWCGEVAIVAMTESRKGLQLWSQGRWRRMDAFPSDEVDPTGAGDTFATAFLIRLHETQDVDEAARFGAAAASLAVRGVGAEAQPSREEIEERMRAYPEVKLR
jgi:hypothetical protein